MSTKRLLITQGQFFVLTLKEVQVHILSADQAALFWEGMDIADTRTERTVDMHRLYVLRQTFGQAAIGFIPAGTVEALLYYVEHYEGPMVDEVKGLAACILTGTPYGGENHQGGGIIGGLEVKVPVDPNAPKDSGGAGAAPTFRELAETDALQAVA